MNSEGSAVTRAELEEIIQKETFMRTFGFRIVEVGMGICTVMTPFNPDFAKPGGFVCGPLFVASADAAIWCAAMTISGATVKVVTSELNSNFLRPAKGEAIWCTGKIIKHGKRLFFGTAECKDEKGLLLSHHTLTYIRLDTWPT